jgi:hypothetical protein
MVNTVFGLNPEVLPLEDVAAVLALEDVAPPPLAVPALLALLPLPDAPLPLSVLLLPPPPHDQTEQARRPTSTTR